MSESQEEECVKCHFPFPHVAGFQYRFCPSCGHQQFSDQPGLQTSSSAIDPTNSSSVDNSLDHRLLEEDVTEQFVNSKELEVITDSRSADDSNHPCSTDDVSKGEPVSVTSEGDGQHSCSSPLHSEKLPLNIEHSSIKSVEGLGACTDQAVPQIHGHQDDNHSESPLSNVVRNGEEKNDMSGFPDQLVNHKIQDENSDGVDREVCVAVLPPLSRMTEGDVNNEQPSLSDLSNTEKNMEATEGADKEIPSLPLMTKGYVVSEQLSYMCSNEVNPSDFDNAEQSHIETNEESLHRHLEHDNQSPSAFKARTGEENADVPAFPEEQAVTDLASEELLHVSFLH